MASGYSFSATPGRVSSSAYKQKRKSQKSFIDPEGEENITYKKSEDLLSLGLTLEKWKTYRINALYFFSYDESSLYKYGKILTAVIRKKEAILSCFQCLPENVVAHIGSFPHMVFSERDNPPVKITVIVKKKGDDDWTTCFQGILLSVERNIDNRMEKRRQENDAVILPLFLVTDTENNIFPSVVRFLEKNFSCLISPLKIMSSDLKWMLALFCPKYDRSSKKSVVIEYASQGIALDTYKCHITNSILAAIWSQMKHDNLDEITEDEVEEYNQTLKSMICSRTSEDISDWELKRIKTPLAEVLIEEYFKPYASEKLFYVMRYLTHLSQDFFK